MFLGALYNSYKSLLAGTKKAEKKKDAWNTLNFCNKLLLQKPKKKVTHESCAHLVHKSPPFLQRCSLPASLSHLPSHCFLGCFATAIWGTFFSYKLQHDHNFLWSSCGRFCLVCLVLKNSRAGIARAPRIPVPTPSQLQMCSWVVQGYY